MRKLALLISLMFFFCPIFIFSQNRTFTELLPGWNSEIRIKAFSSNRYLYFGDRIENLTLILNTGENIRISRSTLGPNSGFFVEALQVLPRTNTNLISIYNALGKIKNLKGKTYYSEASKKHIPLFTDATRIEGPKKLKEFLPDPYPAAYLPLRETFYARMTDTRFGHCYFEISIFTNKQGILYKITNFRTVSYGPIPVMKENTFTALLYFEPIKEGLAMYCLAGAEVSDFITKFVDIRSALIKRLDVFSAWMLDGLH